MSYGEENRAFAQKLGVMPEIFANATVVVELPHTLADRADAQGAFLLAANLLVRLFHRVHLVAPDAAVGAHPWKLRSLHEVGPLLSALTEGSVAWGAPSHADVALGIGCRSSAQAKCNVTVGFGPGLATLDTEPTAQEADALAALIAACYGAAQCFLHVAIAAGANLKLIDPFQFALPSRGANDSVDLGVVHLAGVGAIGCALVYGLAHLPCRGHLIATDEDTVDTSNLHRYVLMKRSDVKRTKVVAAEDALHGTGVSVTPLVSSYQDYLARRGSRRIEVLVSAIDSEAGRRQLAASLPRRIVNASTTDRYVTVSRHRFADGRACLHCLYAPPPGPATSEQRIAQDLGVGVLEVERLIAENKPVDAEFVARVEKNRQQAPGTFAEWIGKPLQSFHQRAVCGSAAIPTTTGTIVSPLGFISTLAGLLLLAELLGGRALGDEDARGNYLRLDALGSPAFADRDIRSPDTARRCICADPDYIDIYRSRYAS